MIRSKLTKRVIDAARPRKDKPASDSYIWDGGKGGIVGFGLKVTPAGGKIFVFQFRIPGMKSDRRYRIGRYGDWTVEEARDRARALRHLVDQGVDPFAHEEQRRREAEVAKREAVDRAFSTIASQWLEAYTTEPRTKGTKRGQLRSQSTIDMSRIAVERLKGEFGDRRIDEIDELDLERAFSRIPGGLATSRNTFAVARILWNWAHRRRIVEDNPFARLEPPAAPPTRDRVLSDDELGIFWRASRKTSYPFGPLHRLLALTGQRRDEVASMAWDELDRDTKEWSIPGDRTKNGVPQIVPLSVAAVGELDAIAPKSDWPSKGLVFTVTGESAVSGFSGAKRRLDEAMKRIIEDEGLRSFENWRVHDLRRTVATGFQRLGIRFEVTEAVLNHVSGSRGGIAGVYQRHNWKAEKRAALDAWAEHLLSITRPRIVPFDSAIQQGAKE